MAFLALLAISLNCGNTVAMPAVKNVYPTGNQLPENLLRVYVTFHTPMKTVGNLEKIRLLDSEGNEVKDVFFNNARELWDHDQRQLTLLLDPARVKTGLKANERSSRALQPAKSYRLVIAGLEDIHHQKMPTPYVKTFRVESADLTPPNVEAWKLNIPQAGSRESFRAVFPEMLDWYSLRQRVVVTDESKNVVKGEITIGDREETWHFTPNEPWLTGDYFLFVNARLEDPAGNNLNGLFDHQVGSLKFDREGETISTKFRVQ